LKRQREERSAKRCLSLLRRQRPSLPSAGMSSNCDRFAPLDTFARRHLGSDSADMAAMLRLLGQPSLESLADAAVPHRSVCPNH